MHQRVGSIRAIYRYPIKSMAGESLDTAELGPHGIEGDRRLALRRVDERGGFPWLTASRLPELIRWVPERHDASAVLPTHVRRPDGTRYGVFDPALAADVSTRFGAPVDLLHLRGGIFDDSAVSLMSQATVDAIASASGAPPDVRRFRPNVLVELGPRAPYAEDAWVATLVTFGDPETGPTIAVTSRDVRCVMVNLDPDTGQSSPAVLKAIGRDRQGMAGVYGTVVRPGPIAVGDAVHVAPVTS
ncbi:MAG: MOSC domain-containing protein [Gemmatimonadaceae bacterium]|nr:MOSC domain-containing protein [Gemmatimonadaceae bacterium]